MSRATGQPEGRLLIVRPGMQVCCSFFGPKHSMLVTDKRNWKLDLFFKDCKKYNRGERGDGVWVPTDPGPTAVFFLHFSEGLQLQVTV